MLESDYIVANMQILDRVRNNTNAGDAGELYLFDALVVVDDAYMSDNSQ